MGFGGRQRQFLGPVGNTYVTVNGQPIAVTEVGFKRRPLYAPFEMYDFFPSANSIVLRLASTIGDNQVVEVKNRGPASGPRRCSSSPGLSRCSFSPAIHVNQEGYMPGFAKKAMVVPREPREWRLRLGQVSNWWMPTVARKSSSSVVRPDSGYTYPADPATWHNGWHHLTECYGHAIRSYAFAAWSGRVADGALDHGFLSKCEAGSSPPATT